MTSQRWGVLLLAHGTVSNLDDLPGFLARVRRGRPAPPELVQEMRRRYEAIGGSPLASISEQQAAALARRLGRPCRAAMRLSAPQPAEVWPSLREQGVDELCLLPLAPFSVDVYVDAARATLPGVAARGVAPWGSHPAFIAAQVARVGGTLKRISGEQLVLTAHSLPRKVIDAGDSYGREFERCATAIGEALGVPFSIAYQSQGADGGDWLGPALPSVMAEQKRKGAHRVVVAPVGFVAEHVETLYDLDIEAKGQAEELGLEFARVPAVDATPDFIEALARIAEAAMAEPKGH